MGEVSTDKLAKLVADVTASGGSELSNYQLFVERLTVALGLPQPEFAREETRFNDYVFERNVTFRHSNGTTSSGRIDCYKRGCFILEAKQSAKRAQSVQADQLQFAGLESSVKAGHAKRGTRGWDKVMAAARAQAEDYARALPVDHGYPPFLLIVDVGHVIEVYADFSGLGKNYEQFPDRRSYRIGMEDLGDEAIQARLRAIWTDPQALNPLLKSAEVTADIAERLARIARRLEKRYPAKDVAEFLMRCLFTMFVEDAGPNNPAERLIPDKGFERLLKQMIGTPHLFAPALEALWRTMDAGGYDPFLQTVIKRFNGSLFRDAGALPLDQDDIIELHNAAKRDWRDVEPAIFGTLLERALEARERSSFGAHYTPRSFVERLVIPTIMEPLRADWQSVKALVADLQAQGKGPEAIKAVRDFHHRLCTARVLDPACGTGNFLYVALELMKRLEGRVLDTLEQLGDDEARLLLDGETVSPRQFFGLELNERAVPIADLVLWIGFLKWQLRTFSVRDIPEPILHAYGTIRHSDALLDFEERVPQLDDAGNERTIWDGVSTKPHPITGERVPDETARRPLYRYVKPRRAAWLPAEFIVGNPPFIAGKDMRDELGDGYAEALWKVRPDVPGGADLVMHFWDEAARQLLTTSPKEKTLPLRRFGFITTNSLTQTFSRRVVERWLGAKEPLSLVYAVPDHPWLKASDKAAVRIAMTVAAPGNREGVLARVVRQAGLDSDTPVVDLDEKEGKITAKLTLGADLTKASELLANELLAHQGYKPYGLGFIVLPSSSVVKATRDRGGNRHVLSYLNGRDISKRPRGVFALDFYGLSQDELRQDFPEAYQHIQNTVYPERARDKRKSYREKWWIFGEAREGMRAALSGLDRFIVTVETAKHRHFHFLSADMAPDQKLRVVAVRDAGVLAILSSRLHVHFSIVAGGWQGVGNDPVYQHTSTFNPFPLAEEREGLAELGERLDAFRKQRLAAHTFLTMTELYNVLERVRELEIGVGDPLTPEHRDIYDAGQIGILKELHDEIDRRVFAAYGWSDLGDRLVGRPGATVPSTHKSADQEAAEDELLLRLVSLNGERAAEERSGYVRWTRPEFQRPKLAHKYREEIQVEADLGEAAAVSIVPWPTDGLDQISAVRRALLDAPAPIALPALAAGFHGRNTPKRRQRVEQVLHLLVETGGARRDPLSGHYYLPR